MVAKELEHPIALGWSGERLTLLYPHCLTGPSFPRAVGEVAMDRWQFKQESIHSRACGGKPLPRGADPDPGVRRLRDQVGADCSAPG